MERPMLLLLTTLIVKVLAQDVTENCSEFSKIPNDLVIAAGGSACLECEYLQSTRLPRWQIQSDTSFTTISASDEEQCYCSESRVNRTRELSFSEVGQSATGEYRCLIQINDTSQFTSCTISVSLAVAPTITQSPPINQTTTVGSTVVLSVAHNLGTPPGNVTWSRQDGNPLDSDRISLVNGDLMIENVEPEDRGAYIFNVANIGGSATANVDLFVTFSEIVSFVGTVDGGNVILVCMGRGYSDIELTLDQGTTDDITQTSSPTPENRFEAVSMIESSVPISTCPSDFRCSISVRGASSTTGQTITPCPNAVMITEVTPLNSSAVRVQWNQGGTGYTLRYKIEGENEYIDIPVPDGLTEIVINGLAPDEMYVISISDNGVDFSEDMTFTLQPCDSSFTMAITRVDATTMTTDNLQNIRLTWAMSEEADVAGYRITVSPCPKSAQCPIEVNGQSITSYEFPTDFCDGVTHTFRVQAINNCGGAGPLSAQVQQFCDNRNRLMQLVPMSNSVTLRWSFKDPSDVESLNISAENVVQRLTLWYMVSPSNVESACIGELESSSTYEVCLMPGLKSDRNAIVKYCDYVTTLSGGSEDSSSCLAPISTVTLPPAETFLNWHIAIIVVGALAIVAMVFCLVGLCFACQSSKQKVDFGSSSSLNTTYNTNEVIRDGMHMQRSNSPSRSCLSYHIKGHSTNWSDHVDTLRQMDTDDGTHV